MLELENFLFFQIETHLLYYSIAIAAIFGKLKESSKRSMLSAWTIYFIGTFFHELTHLLMSIITFGKPNWFSIFPSQRKDEKGNIYYTLGYVFSKNMRWYNVFMISMAPFLLIPLSFMVYENFFIFIDKNLYTYIIYIFIIVSLLFSSVPSGADFKNVFNGIKTVPNLIPAFFILFLIYNVKVNIITQYLDW